MRDRIRRCVECPRCLTRYLVAFSPYCNGSYVVSTVAGFPEGCTLYCSCGRPPVSIRCRWSEVKTYVVSKPAQDRGYGTPEEIVREPESHGMRKHSRSLAMNCTEKSLTPGPESHSTDSR